MSNVVQVRTQRPAASNHVAHTRQKPDLAKLNELARDARQAADNMALAVARLQRINPAARARAISEAKAASL
jgi:hypothetical protein